jgi:hypothetical protein
MSRLQSVITGIATAIALVLVLLSVDVGRVAASFHRLAAAPVALAVVLLAANFALAFLRFQWTLAALGAKIERRAAIYAFALGNLAGQFLLNIIGQSLTRAVVLEASGVPMSATVMATYLERLIALATVGIGAAVAALVLYGSLGFELHNGGAYLLSLTLALALVLAVAGIRGLAAAITADELRRIARTSGRLVPAVIASLLAHLAMFGAYVVLVRAFAPEIGLAKLTAAVVIVMFAAGLPVSWAGWGLREFGAVYTLGAIGVPGEAAIIVAVVVGAASLLISVGAGAAVAIDAWFRPVAGAGRGTRKTADLARVLAPSDPILIWTIGILTACLIFFQLRVPTGGGELTVNAADPIAITALFFAAIFARTDDFLRLFPRPVLWSVAGLAAALTLGLAVAWRGAGVSEWALLNRMLGFLFLLGYAAVPALVMLIAGERGRVILAETFVTAAAAICAFQLAAYAVDAVTPLPSDFFGYLFDKSHQLEGYAQNSNAFAFQLLMAAAVLIALFPSTHSALRWLAAALLWTTLGFARSRAGILCGLAAIPLGMILPKLPGRLRLTSRSLAVVAIAGIAVLVAGVALWGTINEHILAPITHAMRPHADDSDALRWQSTLLGWQAWLRHPVLGGGLGTFLLEREIAGLPPVVIHSVPIWFLAEMGLVGLAAYVALIGSLSACGLAALWKRDRWASGLLIVVAAFVLMGLVHDVFFQRTFWFAAGLALTQVPANLREKRPDAPRAAQSSSNAVS